MNEVMNEVMTKGGFILDQAEQIETIVNCYLKSQTVSGSLGQCEPWNLGHGFKVTCVSGDVFMVSKGSGWGWLVWRFGCRMVYQEATLYEAAREAVENSGN